MSKVITEDFKRNVNLMLSKRGVSRSELARRMGCTPQFIVKLLGPSYDPSLKVVEKVADALEVQVSTLLKKVPEISR